MNILLWHVHGAWTASFVQGPHRYLLPVLAQGGPWGHGRLGRDWPATTEDVPVDQLRHTKVDVVVLQRPEELGLVERWLGRSPGKDLPAFYVEHNTPKGDVPNVRHPLSQRDDIPLVHVTHFNNLMWDSGLAPTHVIDHGIVDPGYRYTGEQARSAVVINEPIRRWRVTGTDLLPMFSDIAPMDVFGMELSGLNDKLAVDSARLCTIGDLAQQDLYDELGRRRVYLHLARWTSLGLSLLEAMCLGMPIVALASTEVAGAVPSDVAVVSTDLAELATATSRFMTDPTHAAHMGKLAREFALDHYSVDSFLRRWNELLADVTP